MKEQTTPPRITPWGPLADCRQIAPGIFRVQTSSHGGIWLSPERQARLPAWTEAPANYCSKPAWWEEDIEANIVLFAFDDAPVVAERQCTEEEFLRGLRHFPAYRHIADAYSAREAA